MLPMCAASRQHAQLSCARGPGHGGPVALGGAHFDEHVQWLVLSALGGAQFDEHVRWLLLTDVDPAWAAALGPAELAAHRRAHHKVVKTNLEYYQCAPHAPAALLPQSGVP